jgi:hypothetical protein
MKSGMGLVRLLGIISVALMVAIHIALTAFDIKSMWPLSPYNLFHQPLPLINYKYEAVLTTKSGKTTEVAPSQLFPLEFFRSVAVVARSTALTPTQQKEFYTMVLKRLNGSPQKEFDEIHASPAADINDPFVKFELFLGHYDLNNFTDIRILRPEQRDLLLSVGDTY